MTSLLDDLWRRLREALDALMHGGRDARHYDENAVVRRRPKRRVRVSTSPVRSYRETGAPVRRRRRRRRRREEMLRIAVRAVLACVFVYCMVSLIGYGWDFVQSRLASRALRETYYEEAQSTPEPQVSAPLTTPTPAPTATPEPDATPAPTATPQVTLRRQGYPENPFARVTSRFEKLRRANADIVGWLNLEDMLDEAVVQRDNDYYLNRDYRGYHNKNGAIFMEQTVDLSTRPYLIALYGHNMKTGAMFGCLRNYEDTSFLRANPFITFDTMYESGRYVIFAVGTYGINNTVGRYVSLGQLSSTLIEQRQTAIDALLRYSIYTNEIDVRPDDQILLLVTCVDDDAERRIVAARRLRDGEAEHELDYAIRHFEKY